MRMREHNEVVGGDQGRVSRKNIDLMTKLRTANAWTGAQRFETFTTLRPADDRFFGQDFEVCLFCLFVCLFKEGISTDKMVYLKMSYAKEKKKKRKKRREVIR